jgi:hypothetical protein
MNKSNILGMIEELSNHQYCLYDTRLAYCLLISTHLVGKVYYAEEVVEGGTYVKGCPFVKSRDFRFGLRLCDF